MHLDEFFERIFDDIFLAMRTVYHACYLHPSKNVTHIIVEKNSKKNLLLQILFINKNT